MGNKDLFIFDTLSGTLKKIERCSQTPIYSCGITPYSPSHIGHGRMLIATDIVTRSLKLFHYESVHSIRNITDIDDKIIMQAKKDGVYPDIEKVTAPVITEYNNLANKLGCLPPDSEPRVTTSIEAIIHCIAQLIESNHAYASKGDVYFRVKNFRSYGELSKKNTQEVLDQVPVDELSCKENEADFALWKGSEENVSWQSPWGMGRPGWHIECSAMINTEIKTPLALHLGGIDLLFPHHENERAQSEAMLPYPLAKCWMHVGILKLNSEKMSKSIGNIISLKELLDEHDPMAVRFYLLQHHYKTPINFTKEALKQSTKAWEKLSKTCNLEEKTKISQDDFLDASKKNFLEECCNDIALDLKTPQAIARLFEHSHEIKNSSELQLLTQFFLQNALGFSYQKEVEASIPPSIQILFEKRKIARGEKNWAEADRIRTEIIDAGYEIKDEKTPKE